jgi:hypothetical protein
MKAAFRKVLRTFKVDDAHEVSDIASVLSSVLEIDAGETKLLEVRLFLKDYTLKLDFNQETDTWISTLVSHCNARIVITLETKCTFSRSSSTGRFSIHAAKLAASSAKVLTRGSSSGVQSSEHESAIDGLNGKVGLSMWYDTLSEHAVWSAMSAEGSNVADLMQSDGYEVAETVSGRFPLAFVIEYLRVAKFKVFSETPLNASADFARQKGVYSARHFCTSMMEYLLFVSKSWKDRVNEQSLDYRIEMNHRVNLLEKERSAIFRRADSINEQNIRIRREY